MKMLHFLEENQDLEGRKEVGRSLYLEMGSWSFLGFVSPLAAVPQGGLLTDPPLSLPDAFSFAPQGFLRWGRVSGV